MDLNSYFVDYLSEIRLTDRQRQDLIGGHSTLRQRLMADEKLKPIIVSTFLQGSYRRGTAVRPAGDERSDVDVVVVTRLDKDAVLPGEALRRFQPFLEKHYSGKYRFQGRSIGIELSYVDLDLVVTSAPSEVMHEVVLSHSISGHFSLEDAPDWHLSGSWLDPDSRASVGEGWLQSVKLEPEWKTEPLYIPDRETESWERTDPIAQMHWTHGKNARTDGRFVDIVKIVKWLQRTDESMPKHPSGYLLERLVGEFCPDDMSSLADGLTRTLEQISETYRAYAETGQVPVLPDHGIPENNVLARVSPSQFARFHKQVARAARTARQALDSDDEADSASKWRSVLGERFPKPPSGDDGSKGGGFTKRAAPSVVSRGRFA